MFRGSLKPVQQLTRVIASGVCLFLLLWIPACGTSSTGASNNPTGGTGGGSGGSGSGNGSGAGGTSNPGGQLITPTVVSVTSSTTTSGINITVPNTASPLNVTVLGANPSGSTTGSASSGGGTIQRGQSAWVLLFGSGLNGSLKVSISGPADIGISNIQGVTATDNTPGISFTATVGSGAAVGARTVTLTDPNNNVTTFTGGLEIF